MATTGWFRGPDIGCGATSIVSLAASADTGDVFAVKSALLSRYALLHREQSILSSVKSPFIISCLGFEISPGSGGALSYNIFLEYAAGGSLSDEIRRRGGCLNDAQIRSRTREILSGLADLHGAGVVHCDVKPDNVLIGSNGRAKIGDLGCARLISDGKGEIRGSPMYMAPEAVRGEEQGMPADVWALGCVVLEMATGRPPWPDVADVAAGIRRIGFSCDLPAIPDWLSDEAMDFVTNCLRTDPTKRWTADELLHHPFVKISGYNSTWDDLSWASPKSTLDLGFWESMEELEDEGELSEEAAGTIIRDLAADSKAPDWSWDEDWEDVRKTAGEYSAETEVTGGEMAGSQFLIANEATSTSYEEEEFVLCLDRSSNESYECCQWEEWDREAICCKSRTTVEFRNQEEYHFFGIFNLRLHLDFLPFDFRSVVFRLGILVVGVEQV